MKHRKWQPNRLGWQILAMLLLASGLASRSSAQDTVTLTSEASTSGPKLVGKVLAVRRDAIKFSYQRKEKIIRVNEIARISFADEPADLAKVRKAVISGRDQEAREILRNLNMSDSSRDVVKQEVGYYLCLAEANLALAGNGEVEAAIKRLLSYLKREKNSIRFYASVELLGDLAAATGKYDDADRYYSQLEKSQIGELKLRGKVLRGNVLQVQENWGAAIEMFQAAVDMKATGAQEQRIRLMATVGLATCKGADGDVEQAVKTLEQMIESEPASDTELFARIYLGLGLIHRQADRPMDAILEYLHVDLLFQNESDAHAEALYYLVKLWPEVNQPSRGVAARQELQKRYAGTSWAKRTR